jgi:Domain of unknown function (DUF4345)
MSNSYASKLLWINSVLFLVFGVLFLLIPNVVSSFVTGGTFTTPDSIIDVRATYGGITIGLGIFMASCARNPEHVFVGLKSALMIMISIATARLIGILIEGSANIYMFALLGLEVVFIFLLVKAVRIPLNK